MVRVTSPSAILVLPLSVSAASVPASAAWAEVCSCTVVLLCAVSDAAPPHPASIAAVRIAAVSAALAFFNFLITSSSFLSYATHMVIHVILPFHGFTSSLSIRRIPQIYISSALRILRREMLSSG